VREREREREMGLCGSVEEAVVVEDTVKKEDLEEVGKFPRPRLILAQCTEVRRNERIVPRRIVYSDHTHTNTHTHDHRRM